MNWSAYQTRVNEDEPAEGRFTLAEPPSAMATTCRKRGSLPRHPAVAYLFLVSRCSRVVETKPSNEHKP